MIQGEQRWDISPSTRCTVIVCVRLRLKRVRSSQLVTFSIGPGRLRGSSSWPLTIGTCVALFMFIVREVTKMTQCMTALAQIRTDVNFTMARIFYDPDGWLHMRRCLQMWISLRRHFFLIFPHTVPTSDYWWFLYYTHRPYPQKMFENFRIQVFTFVSPYHLIKGKQFTTSKVFWREHGTSHTFKFYLSWSMSLWVHYDFPRASLLKITTLAVELITL